MDGGACLSTSPSIHTASKGSTYMYWCLNVLTRTAPPDTCSPRRVTPRPAFPLKQKQRQQRRDNPLHPLPSIPIHSPSSLPTSPPPPPPHHASLCSINIQWHRLRSASKWYLLRPSSLPTCSSIRKRNTPPRQSSLFATARPSAPRPQQRLRARSTPRPRD